MTISTQPDYQLYEYAVHRGERRGEIRAERRACVREGRGGAVAKGLPIPPRDTGKPVRPAAPGTAPARLVNEQ